MFIYFIITHVEKNGYNFLATLFPEYIIFLSYLTLIRFIYLFGVQ